MKNKTYHECGTWRSTVLDENQMVDLKPLTDDQDHRDETDSFDIIDNL
jgi:hypothetical protein